MADKSSAQARDDSATATAEAQSAHDPIEAFIIQHRLDSRVTQGLRSLPVESQLTIIKEDMASVRNPSAVVWSRIKARQRLGPGNIGSKRLREEESSQPPRHFDRNPVPPRYPPHYPQHHPVEHYAPYHTDPLPPLSLPLPPRPPPQAIQPPPFTSPTDDLALAEEIAAAAAAAEAATARLARAQHQAGLAMSARQAAEQDAARQQAWATYYAQQSQQEMLRQQYAYGPPVPAQHPHQHLTTHQGPSSTFVGNAAAGINVTGVAEFISTYGLDERCSKGLLGLNPEQQHRVMSRDLRDVKNPSAVVWSRVRAAQHNEL